MVVLMRRIPRGPKKLISISNNYVSYILFALPNQSCQLRYFNLLVDDEWMDGCLLYAYLAMFHIIIILVIIFNIIIQPTVGFSYSPSRIKDTKVNVNGKATVLITTPPLQHTISNNVTLTHYMQLPVEQYVLIPMPLGSSLTTRVRLRDDDGINDNNQQLSSNTEFELVVPTITFFSLSLTPVVYASVQPQENQVVISSNQCILRGSSFIEKVQLNERFDFFVNTTLTWTDDTTLAHENGDKDINANSTACSITAETCINVDVDVPRPFNTIPKRIIERTGNAAMHISLRYIQESPRLYCFIL